MGRKEKGAEMGMEEAFESTLDAIAKIQRNVSMMLGAKAAEAEKVRNWLLHHFNESIFQSHSDRLAACLQIHEQQIEVIDGLTKLCNGLSRNMRVILHPDENDGESYGAEDQGKMNRLDREWEIRLHLLESIARSQEALAVMLESAADVTAAAGIPPSVLREHVRVLEGMQAALLRTVTGTGWRPPKRGTPASPWLRAGVCRTGQRETGGGA